VRLVQPMDYSILKGPVQPCNIDLLLIRIVASPEEVSGDPVYSETLSIREVWSKKGRHFEHY